MCSMQFAFVSKESELAQGCEFIFSRKTNLKNSVHRWETEGGCGKTPDSFKN